MQTGLALGSNLGDRLAHLKAGRDFLLTLHEGPRPPAVSPIYETAPVGCPPGSPAFFNAVIEIESSLDPATLLARLTAFEQQRGRHAQRANNAPRPLDLDILYAGHTVLHLPSLTVPHPRLAQRRFVLQPLSDIRSHLILPGHSLDVTQLLTTLPNNPPVRLFANTW